jgi:hypothetical protein
LLLCIEASHLKAGDAQPHVTLVLLLCGTNRQASTFQMSALVCR